MKSLIQSSQNLTPEEIEAAKRFREDYNHFAKFCNDYNPSMGLTLYNDSTILARVAENKDIPTLKVVCAAIGENNMRTWFKIQFDGLCVFVEKCDMSEEQMGELSMMIVKEYGHLRLAEVLIFFAELKAGNYGECYGTMGPTYIMTAMKKFIKHRGQAMHDYKVEQDKLRREQEEKERKGNTWNFNEFLEHRDRAKKGDPEEKKIFTHEILPDMYLDPMTEELLAKSETQEIAK